MKKLVTLTKDSNIIIKNDLVEFLSPSFVYLPMDKNVRMLTQNKRVKKGTPIYQIKNKIFHSPISGKITGIIKIEKKFYLKIKNDYKETDTYAGVNEFTTVRIRTDFKEKIKENTIYSWPIFKHKKRIILHGMEDEPYVKNKSFLHKYYASEILKMLDLIADTFQIECIDIYVKENDLESIEAFQKWEGTYPNVLIKILPDVYPIGHEKILANYLKLEEKTIILHSEDVYDLYNEVIKARKKDSLLVTITGDAIKNPQVIRVKVGTLLKEVVEKTILFKEKDYVIMLNGLIMGSKVNLVNVVITEDVKVIYFMKPVLYHMEECISCGKCITVCPLKCNPYKSYITKGKYRNENCIRCGLCTFVCPSYICLDYYLKEGVK